jgi:two-component system, response regulator FlrC
VSGDESTMTGQGAKTADALGMNLPETRWLLVRGRRTAIRVALPAFGTVTLGESEENDVRIDEPDVAARHAIVRLLPGVRIQVLDADSGIVRSSRAGARDELGIEPGAELVLEPGTTLRFGSVEVELVHAEASEPAHRIWSRAHLERRLRLLAERIDTDWMLLAMRAAASERAAEIAAVIAARVSDADVVTRLEELEYAILIAESASARGRSLALEIARDLESRGVDVEIGSVERGDAEAASALDVARERMSRLASKDAASSLIVEDAAMRRVIEQVDQVAESASPVLVTGETGTGKDLIARLIHARSSRALRPLVRINCADAGDAPQDDLIARAAGGTVLLDEVGALSARAQVRWGQILEHTQEHGRDVRFIATSNHDLRGDVKRGAFRKELFFRLNRLSIVVPPLRERPLDIVALAEHFARETSRALRRPRTPKLSEEAKKKLLPHGWSGNVRELQGVIERAVTMAGGERIGAEHIAIERLDDDTFRELGDAAAAALPAATPARDEEEAEAESGAEISEGQSLRDELAALERRRILEALDKYPTQADAAKALDIPLRTFLNRLDALGINRPRKPKRGE